MGYNIKTILDVNCETNEIDEVQATEVQTEEVMQ